MAKRKGGRPSTEGPMKVGARFRVTIPVPAREALKLGVGDSIEFEVLGPGDVRVHRVRVEMRRSG